jgi:hypothetical protein
MIALQAFVSQQDTATATATFEFIRNMATSLSVVIGGVVFQNGIKLRKDTLLAAGVPPDITAELSGQEAAANVMLIATLPTEEKQVAREAFAWALRNMWILYCGIAFVSFAASFGIKKSVLGREHEETRTGLREKGAVVQDLAGSGNGVELERVRGDGGERREE